MDTIYIIIIAVVFIFLIMIGLAIVNYSGQDLVAKYREYSKIPTSSTPINFFNNINTTHFYGSIRLKFTDKELGDSYDSRGMMTMCQKYATDHNLVGIAICAHELGHAFQFKNEKKRMAKFIRRNRRSKILSKFTVPLLIAAVVLLFVNELIIAAVVAGVSVLTFIFAIISKWMTIKVENDASKKALELIQNYAYFTESELQKAKDFLKAAKNTYVAAMLKSMLKWTMLVKK